MVGSSERTAINSRWHLSGNVWQPDGETVKSRVWKRQARYADRCTSSQYSLPSFQGGGVVVEKEHDMSGLVILNLVTREDVFFAVPSP